MICRFLLFNIFLVFIFTYLDLLLNFRFNKLYFLYDFIFIYFLYLFFLFTVIKQCYLRTYLFGLFLFYFTNLRILLNIWLLINESYIDLTLQLIIINLTLNRCLLTYFLYDNFVIFGKFVSDLGLIFFNILIDFRFDKCIYFVLFVLLKIILSFW